MGILRQIEFYKNLFRHYTNYGRKYNYELVSHSDQITIPKVIHYCWFGKGKQSALIEKCIESWKEILPEYEIVLWNEDNFPIDKYPFAKQALEDKKWAFVSDVARLHALYYYGGVYMDTDVEVIKPIDNFLQHGFFSSYESGRHLPTGIMGAKKGNNYVKLLLDWYKFPYSKAYYRIANTRIITKLTRIYCKLHLDGKQYEFADCCYYPREYFCPKWENDKFLVTENTYTIHHFTGMW